jgi:hypothetical protein
MAWGPSQPEMVQPEFGPCRVPQDAHHAACYTGSVHNVPADLVERSPGNNDSGCGFTARTQFRKLQCLPAQPEWTVVAVPRSSVAIKRAVPATNPHTPSENVTSPAGDSHAHPFKPDYGYVADAAVRRGQYSHVGKSH